MPVQKIRINMVSCYLLSLLSFFFFVINAGPQQSCEKLVIGFDDIRTPLTSNTIDLDWPYEDFIFSRGSPSGYKNQHLPVMNTSGVESFKGAASSRSNILLSSGEPIVIRHVGASFVLISLSMMSVWVDNQAMFIQMERNGTVVHRMTLVLPLRARSTILIDSKDHLTVDKVTIGCQDYVYDKCGDIAYDDFLFCYKHSL